MSTVDPVFFFALAGIWLAQVYWSLLSLGALLYAAQCRRDAKARQRSERSPDEYPLVSVLIPAHNEELVINRTLRAFAALEYPRLEILLINDDSRDRTREIAQSCAGSMANLRVIDVPKGQGHKGKSRTLNVGLRHARGEVIAVYDADNTPEPDCLRRLVGALLDDQALVAVNGKVRTRNWRESWLTRFINVEFIFFQWIFQGGRWYWFRLSTLMGTNFVIWREALEILGGFDEASLVDDREMSLRIFMGKRRIRWIPDAVSWEQEPATFGAWLRQRTRWAQGAIYVIAKFLPAAVSNFYPLGLELANDLFNYLVFVPALVSSHLVFLLGLADRARVTLSGPYWVAWGCAIVLYVVEIWVALFEERQPLWTYLLAVASYFTYASLFVVVVCTGFFEYLRSRLTGSEVKWAKTARSVEDLASEAF